VSPSLTKKSDTSGPERNSSTSTGRSADRSACASAAAVVGDDDALAGGEAIGLHDVGRAVRVEGGLDLGAGRGAGGAAGGHARGIHDPLRERLRSLELRAAAGPGRTPGCRARAARRRPRDQRRLGPDDHEVDVSSLA
jgi:hypothetical protein